MTLEGFIVWSAVLIIILGAVALLGEREERRMGMAPWLERDEEQPYRVTFIVEIDGVAECDSEVIYAEDAEDAKDAFMRAWAGTGLDAPTITSVEPTPESVSDDRDEALELRWGD